MHRSARLQSLLFLSVIFPATIFGQSIPSKGTVNTFDLATWNIEWFGGPSGPSNDEQQFLNVLEIMRAADIDLWALQEISDTADFARLLDSLGTSYNGFLATQSSGSQRIGFLYDTDVVRLINQMHILESFSSDFASRPPLQMEAEISIGDSSRVFTFITIHMKAFSDTESYDKRLAASGRLKNHIDFTGLEDEPVIILGDYNDELMSSITSGRDSPYDNFLQDSDDFFFASLPLEQDGRNSWCSSSQCTSGSTIDHILITNEVVPFLVGNSVDHYEELLAAISSYTNSTSDHLPIFARFDISMTSDIDEIPGIVSIADLYPNPFSDRFAIRLTDSRYVRGSAEVFDVTGKLVHVQDLVTGSVEIDLTGQPAAVYFVRLTSGALSATHRVVKVR